MNYTITPLLGSQLLEVNTYWRFYITEMNNKKPKFDTSILTGHQLVSMVIYVHTDIYKILSCFIDPAPASWI